MRIEDMTFGIEFETTVPRRLVQDGTIRVGGYSGPGATTPGLPAGWGAKSDGSIRSGRDRVGVEFVSPVLRGEEGLRQIKRVCEKFREWDVKVNDSCGLHVHVGFDRAWIGVLERLLHLTANYENAIYAVTGTTRRERGGWCRSVRRHGDAAAALQAGRDRYHVLNTANLTSGRKPTVEFRAFSATTQSNKAIAYVRLCIALVQRASRMKRKTKWTGKTPEGRSPMKRKTPAMTEWTRLKYQIGWTRGSRKIDPCGAVVADDLPSLDDSKKVLTRLARKYAEAATRGE